MKKLLTVFYFQFLFGEAFSQVCISGEIKNTPDTSEVKVVFYNNIIEWQEVTAGIAKLDKQGKFTLSFKLNKPEIATLIIAEKQTDLFLLPNDSFHISVDYSNFDSTIFYSGRGAADNNYLAADHLADFSKKANRYSFYNDAYKYKLYEDSIEKANWDFFKAHDNPQFTPEFRSYMTTEIRYKFINSRWMYKVGYDRENKKFFEKAVPENYYDFLKTLNLNDEDAIDNSYYQSALMRYLSEMNDSKTNKEVSDTIPELQRMKMRITKNYNFRKKIFTKKILDFELTTFLHQYLGYVSTDTKYCDELLTDYKATCKNSEFISIIENLYSQARKLAMGNIAPDFTLVDSSGKSVSLSSLKGKTIYLDFWATWCVPCISALKRSHELMERLKHRSDITFLYVNVNDDADRWKNYLRKENMQGVNLIANKTQSDFLYKTYNFSGIPHYVLIDKQGKLVDSNAKDPGNAEKTILEAIK